MNQSKHRFFCSNLDQGFLDEDEAGHAIRVLRLKAGDEITIVDGMGTQVTATIREVGKKNLHFMIVNKDLVPFTGPQLHIAIAPTKNIDRFEFFLEKTCEMGIQSITPLRCRNSERKEIKPDKLMKTLISAVKQSGQLYLPVLTEMMDLQRFISVYGSDFESKYIAHCESDLQKKELKSMIDPSKKTAILIGPEGDFTAEEINLAKESGFIPVSLGNARLRTETAGILACATIHIKA